MHRSTSVRMSLGLLAVFFAAGSHGAGSPTIKQARAANDAKIDRAACASVGGAVKPQGMFGFSACVKPTSDGGKACTAQDQCESRCLAPENAVQGSTATGYCQRDDARDGCIRSVENGIVSGIVCHE